ncbi:TIGR03546 family protein [Gracilimonas sediminicola]|uniref:TIGR03546 family protein n=1 Tax=Gracilimonas sediminicola TaxID=2952158 RepID=A0A9X2L3J6_9BACT|nr:TIGR03546 family protein [Gracilimonas sediminicola]MCP9291676.1 TIGR03546 family protein [Gracilimonas sediminicola]
MFLLMRYIAKLLKALASETSPGQIAGGIILGMIIGLTPLSSLHNLLIVVLILVLKVNIGMAILSFTIFSGIAYLADPLFHSFGVWLLELESMQETWTAMYNNEWIALTEFYNTVVIGSFVTAILLCFPVFPLARYGVLQYREHIHAKIQKWKIVQAFKGTKFYSIYQTVNRVRG